MINRKHRTPQVAIAISPLAGRDLTLPPVL
jgi:hypothetical protein